jgi:hypothetical protein
MVLCKSTKRRLYDFSSCIILSILGEHGSELATVVDVSVANPNFNCAIDGHHS